MKFIKDKLKLLSTKELLLAALSFVAFFTAAYYSLTAGRGSIHSDTATACLLARAVADSGSPFPAGWSYGNSDVWVHNIGLYTLPFSLLLKDQSLARMLGSIFCILCGCVGMIYVSRRGFKNNAWLIMLPLFLLFLTGQSDMHYFQAAGTGHMLLLSVLPLLYFRICRKAEGRVFPVLFAISLALLCMGGIRILAEQLVPLFAAALICLWCELCRAKTADWKGFFKEVFRRWLWLAVPAFFGFAVYLLIYFTHNVYMRPAGNAFVLAENIQILWSNSLSVIGYFFKSFGYVGSSSPFTMEGMSSLVAFVMCCIVVFVVPILQARRIRQEDAFTQFFFVFTLVHNFIMLFMMVFIGFMEERYLITAIYAAMLLSGRYIYSYWIRGRKPSALLWCCLFVLSLVVQGSGMLSKTPGWREQLAKRKALCTELADMGLKKGYAEYWSAYSNEVYSDMRIRFGAVYFPQYNVVPHYWLNDISAYEPVEGRSFILLEKKRDFDAKLLDAKFGPAADVLERGEYLVYIYDHDIAKEMHSVLNDGVIEARELMHRVDYEDPLNIRNDMVEVRADFDVCPECFSMDAGEYMLSYEGEGLEHMWTQVSSRTNKLGTVEYELLSQSPESVQIRLKIGKDLPLVELRTGCTGDESVWLKEIRVQKLK